jgi:hypothetical protein
VNGALIVPVIIALVVVIAVVVVARARRSNDGVDSFRRQIDALSPEARRPVIDQVQNAAGRQTADDDAGADDDDDDGGGSHGT